MAASNSAKSIAVGRRSLSAKEAAFVGSAMHMHSKHGHGIIDKVTANLHAGKAHRIPAGHLGSAVRATKRAVKMMPDDSPRASMASRAHDKLSSMSYPMLGSGQSAEPGTYGPSQMPMGGM